MRTRTRPAELLLALVVLLLPAAARADLEADATALASAWRAEGSPVREYPASLLERGEQRLLLLPDEVTSSKIRGCTTVVVLGSVSTSFVLSFARPRHRSERAGSEWPRIAVAGTAQITRCGDQRASLSRLLVEMRSPRAVLEVIVARSPAPLPAVQDVLPERNPGPIAPPTSSGPRPMLGKVSVRARSFEASAKRQGAVSVKRRLLHSDGEGSGGEELIVAEGCHRIAVLGSDVSTSRRPPDIDAAVAERGSGAMLASDRTESADAALEFCVGKRRLLELHFAGAAPRDEVVVLHARAPLPTGLPDYWGALARGRMAQALREHHLRSLAGSPVYDSLGVVGVTALPVEVEPGACYVATVAALRGDAKALALAASVGAGDHENQTTGAGTALAFCVDSSHTALLEVEGRGQGLVWLAAMWQVGHTPIGGTRP